MQLILNLFQDRKKWKSDICRTLKNVICKILISLNLSQKNESHLDLHSDEKDINAVNPRFTLQQF